MDVLKLENLFDQLFPITRSISGDGLRASLALIGEHIPLNIIEYPSGTQCFDWTLPDEWNIKEACIKNTSGETVIDFKNNNLHVLGFSIPFKGRVSLVELKEHLNFIKEKPNAIPFVTSYYQRRWGLCLSYSDYVKLNDKEYDVLIDSNLKSGSISVGECFIKGQSEKEIILFSHIGHPSMANDQLSGPLSVVTIARWLLKSQVSLKYSYRIILAPETVGSIAYIHSNLEKLKKNCIGGYTVVCTGDGSPYNYRKSKNGKSITDFAMEIALENSSHKYSILDFSPLGCDERHFNSHGINIPIGSIMRSIPGSYPEYHTSLDDKEFISFENVKQTADIVINAIKNLEKDIFISAIHKNCEPKLDKYGLYPTLSDKQNNILKAQQLLSLWAYADGSSLRKIARNLKISFSDARKLAEELEKHNIVRINDIYQN